MMTEKITRIQKALSETGAAWMFEQDAEERATALMEQLTEAESLYNQRYSGNINMLDSYENNFEKFLPFLQSISLPMSPEIRVVIFRICEGMEILEMNFQYLKEGDSSFSILLSGEPKGEPIIAAGPWDAMILSQLAQIITDEKLLFGTIRPWELPEER